MAQPNQACRPAKIAAVSDTEYKLEKPRALNSNCFIHFYSSMTTSHIFCVSFIWCAFEKQREVQKYRYFHMKLMLAFQIGNMKLQRMLFCAILQ